MRRTWTLRVAWVAAAGAVVLLATVSGRAMRIPPDAPVVPAEPALDGRPPVGSRRPAHPGEGAIAGVLEANPFHPERRRGGTFGAGVADGAAANASPAPPAPAAFLSGTALTGGASDFVICGLAHQTPRIVRIGEDCGALELVDVEEGRARFRDEAGDDVVLDIPKAGSP